MARTIQNTKYTVNIFLKIVLSTIGIIFIIGLIYRFRLELQGGFLKVTSWWRSPWSNDEVGGVKYSKHLIGWAFDIVPVNDITGAKLNRMGFSKIINEGDHFHVEIF